MPVVFITGASAGIGAAAVGVFAHAGYDVVLGARRKERLDKIAAEIFAQRPEVKLLPVVCDVDSDASVAAAFTQAAERFGKLDALINNAGFGIYGRAADLPLQKFRDNMETNYFGVIRCTQAALPLLRKARELEPAARPAIIMVSSFVGRRALPLMAAYCASKFALEGFSESLRAELWDEKISVSVVNPGVTRTEFFSSAEGKRPESYLAPEGGMSSEDVARVLLRAVKHPRRNRYLTAAGKAGMVMQWLAPSVFDRVMARQLRRLK